MILIGIVGQKASGKDTIAQYIVSKTNGARHSHSEILDDVLAVLSIPNSRENAVKLVALREKFGNDVLIHALNKKIRAEIANVVVVTGIRFENELQNIRSYPNSKIIYVDSELRIRYERQLQRHQRTDDDMAFEKFVELEQAVTERGIAALADKVDFRVTNNGSEEDLHKQVDNILEKILN